MNTKLTTAMKVKDSEGNIFTVTGYTFERITNKLNGVTLKGAAGEKQISIHDLEFYEEIK